MTGTIISAARRRWMPAAAVAASAALLFAGYLRQARAVPASSDGAANALQAWDMLHGDLLLRGWSLSDVSFYTTELPQYALVEAVHGLNSDTVHVAAAMTYTLVVLLAAALARGHARGAEGAVRAVLAAGIMFAPQQADGGLVLLSSPDHVGTQVPLLLVWLVLDRARPRWWVPLAVAVLLAWAQMADALVLVEGVLPLAVVSAVRIWRGRGAWRGQWLELSLAVGSILAVAVADLALLLIRHAGGFVVQVPRTVVTGVGGLAIHAWYTGQGVLLLYGADFLGQPTVPATVFAVLHLAGVALVGWALARALRRFTGAGLIVQVLTVAFVLLLASYLASGTTAQLSRAREIVGILPIGAVLAGRCLPWPAGRPVRRPAGRLVTQWPAAAALAVLACYAAAAGYGAARSPAPGTDQQVGSWLQAHHLTEGLAGYWEAASVTVASSGRVRVGAVCRAGRKVRILRWEAKESWYDPGRHDDTFFIYSPRDARFDAFDSPSPAAARAVFGRPAKVYQVHGDTVMVWHKNLLTGLPRWPALPASRLAGTLGVGALLS